MVAAAERDRELVAHLEAKGPRLGEAKMVGVGRLPPADEAGLRAYEFQVRLVTQSLGLPEGQDALVDLTGWEEIWL